MSSGPRMPLATAQILANTIWHALEPHCERIAIAGSIRREKETIGDIELVLIPRYVERVTTQPNPQLSAQASLFDDTPATIDIVERHNEAVTYLQSLHAKSTITPRQIGKDGTPNVYLRHDAKHIRLFWHFGFYNSPVSVDIFTATPSNWGTILWLRTGPDNDTDPANRLMMNRPPKGLRPPDVRMEDGNLWQNGVIVPTPDEETVFHLFRLAYVPPSSRSVQAYHLARSIFEKGESL